MRDVTIKDHTIRLGQLLKLADVVQHGSDVKELLASGAVQVNDEVEIRRGRQLVRGDLITIVGNEELRVS
jgi:ribosome-associated protein